MKPGQEDYGNKGMFTLHDDNQLAGKMTYSRAGESLIIIDGTQVEEAYRGQNVGQQLLQQAVNFARSQHIQILPLCPFAKNAFEKDPSIHDVLRS